MANTEAQKKAKYSLFTPDQKRKAEVIVSEEQLKRGKARRAVEDHFERLLIANKCSLPFDEF